MALSEYVETHLKQRAEYYESITGKKLSLKLLIKVYEQAKDDAGEEALYSYAKKEMTAIEVRQVINELGPQKP